ncbi:hypothetical protein [Phyllobacterium zundukense]|uniref:Uncharacterized protein n=2 Tax=Phyllobacterium zundukense TaxID=1867719 RepID=A0ACD4CYB6_9HYPH|nr:hypothetical protein [Phyllobacterium zundukense]UXN58418.1 hypothetical protein N8E88_10235 [Phyllobacterium zundukense]UXN58558.1 hypothetical protein N8E88_11110 [Phyllobacterium zundukense]
MKRSATILAIAALGAMMAAGSVTESMARGGDHDGGGRSGDHGGIGRGLGGGDHSFGGRDHGSREGGIFGTGGVFGARAVAVSHDRFGDRRDHLRDFNRDDNYGSCEYPHFGNSPTRYCE